MCITKKTRYTMWLLYAYACVIQHYNHTNCTLLLDLHVSSEFNFKFVYHLWPITPGTYIWFERALWTCTDWKVEGEEAGDWCKYCPRDAHRVDKINATAARRWKPRCWAWEVLPIGQTVIVDFYFWLKFLTVIWLLQPFASHSKYLSENHAY